MMTAAQIRTLRAVREGLCERRYHAKGNTMHGAPPTVLHKLSQEHFIEDERAPGQKRSLRAFSTRSRFKLVLTDKGRMALREADSRSGEAG